MNFILVSGFIYQCLKIKISQKSILGQGKNMSNCMKPKWKMVQKNAL